MMSEFLYLKWDKSGVKKVKKTGYIGEG